MTVALIIMKIVLSYSGGLDTSVVLRWLKENYQAEHLGDIGALVSGFGMPSTHPTGESPSCLAYRLP